MLKKIIPIILCFCLALSVGCSKNKESLEVEKVQESTSSEKKEELYVNSLTGVAELTKAEASQRPVAIMINNISTAQPVQTGLNKADIVYETEVEGGITRLLAVYKNVNKVEKVGTVRSARYVYIDLAMGHDAIYIHHGQDPNYAAPHLKHTTAFTLSEKNAGARISNGLSKEHTLYAYGEKLWNFLQKSKINTQSNTDSTWQKFSDKDTSVAFSNTANSVTVPFSNSYKTTFKYDSATGEYTRFFKNVERKDYNTKESTTVKNVFVLYTTISNYPLEKYRKVALESGNGYYFVNGTYTPIIWSKGASSNGFTFKNTDGTELTVNQGSSWVCIADKNKSQAIIG